MNISPIPLYLISGFLGSGKSSFLLNILEKLGDRKKIGIVQNEFSSINIDSKILKESNKSYSILEVNHGSIFCLCLLNDFIPSLSDFIDKEQPETIFIEATGLSDPMAIIRMVNSPLLSSKIRFSKAYTIVDGYMFEKQIKMLKSVSNQIKIADTVLINKCDKINSEESVNISNKVKECNPFCNVLFTEYAKLPDYEIDIILNNSSYAQSLTNFNEDECKPLSAPPDIKVETIITSQKISKENFGTLAELLKPLIRAKGFLRATDGSNWAVQAVSGDVSFREYNSELLRSEMVIFGKGLNAKLITKLLRP